MSKVFIVHCLFPPALLKMEKNGSRDMFFRGYLGGRRLELLLYLINWFIVQSKFLNYYHNLHIKNVRDDAYKDEMQCAAVTIQSGAIKDPPQLNDFELPLRRAILTK